MASTNVGSVWFDVNANTKGLMSSTRDVNKATDSMASSLNKVSAAISGVLAAGSLAKFFTDAANAAKQFNASVSELSAITGAVGKDLKFLRDVALEFGATTTLSASQAATALKLVASAKPDLLENGAALKEVTKQAILLAEAAGVDLADAATTVGKSLNQFSADSKEAARFVNVLAAGAKFGSSEIAATSVALKSAGVAASSAKISFEETNAAIQVLATVGLQGEQAGTALRNIFLKLNNDADKKLRPSVVGLSKALENVNKLNESGAEQVKRFGLENIVAAQTLLSNIKNVDTLTKKLTGTNTAFEQASTKVDNLDGDLKALNSAFEALQINVGSLADEELRALTKAATGIIQALNGNQAALKEWGGLINGVQTAAESLAIILASRLVSSIVATGTAFISAQAQAIRYQAALASMAGVSSRAAVGMAAAAGAARLLSSAMALVGGPVGAVVLAASALLYFSNKAKEAKEQSRLLIPEIDTLVESFKGLTRAQREVQISKFNTEMSGLRTQIKSNNDQIEQLNELVKSTFNESTRFGLINEIERLTEANKDLESQLNVISAKQQAVFAAGMPEINQGGDSSTSESVQSINESSDAIKKISEALEDERKQLTMTADGFEQYALRKKLASEGASEDVIQNSLSELRALQELRKEVDLMNKVDEENESRRISVTQQVTSIAEGKDPLTQLQAERDRQLALVAEYEELETAQHQVAVDARAAIDADYNAKKAAAAEAAFVQQSTANQLIMDGLNSLGDTASSVFTGMLTQTMSLKDAARGLANAIANDAINAIIQMGIQYVKTSIIQQSADQAAMASKQALQAAAAVQHTAAVSATVAELSSLGAAAAFASTAAIPMVGPALAPAAALAAGGAIAAIGAPAIAAAPIAGGRLYGGNVNPGTMYPVNENGAPEMFTDGTRQYLMPNTRGDVISNKDATSAGGGLNVYNNIVNNTSSQVTSSSRIEGEGTNRRLIIDTVVSDIRSGGPTRRAITDATTAKNRTL